MSTCLVSGRTSGRLLVALLAATAVLAGCGDDFTDIVLANGDADYVVKTAEEGGEDTPATQILSAHETGSMQIGTKWRGTVRLLDRATCVVLAELRVEGRDTRSVVRGGTFQDVTFDLDQSDYDLTELAPLDACRP